MGKQLKILMVEDSASDAEIVQYELRKYIKRPHFTVVFSEKMFKKAIKEIRPDLILSDFSMPGFDGLSALRIAKKLCPGIPFVFVSGTIGEERAIEAIRSGATDYVIKDHLAGLGPKVKRALKEAAEKREKERSERKLIEREKELRESQRRGKVGSFKMNLHSKRILWSEETYELFGFDDKSISISLQVFHDVIHPQDVEKVISSREEALKAKKPYSITFRVIRKNDGSLRNFFAHAEVDLDDHGHPAYIKGTVQDITDLIHAEQQLEEKNKELRLFIYKSSHDLRAPISSALGLCSLVDKTLAESPSARSHIELIKNCLNKLDRIVGTLTETVAIRDQELTIQKVNIGELIENVQGRIRHIEGYSRINFKVKGSDTEISSDPKVLTSVFQNLIENSIKYQNYGERKPFIDIDIKKEGNNVHVTLSDNGIGISPKVQSKVFDMFFRAHETSKGSGLGLYIVKNAIEKLKGSISLTSKENVGSTFTLVLPQG